METPVELVKSRPAETAMPIATVLAALIARLVGVKDTDTILYIALALSFVPAMVTWIVELIRKRELDGTTYQSSTKPPTKPPTKRPSKPPPNKSS